MIAPASMLPLRAVVDYIHNPLGDRATLLSAAELHPV
jgi:hypothetical protein